MDTAIKIGRELIGLFVDDGNLALTIIALLAAVYALTRAYLVSIDQAGVVLVAGSALLLVFSVVSAAGR